MRIVGENGNSPDGEDEFNMVHHEHNGCSCIIDHVSMLLLNDNLVVHSWIVDDPVHLVALIQLVLITTETSFVFA